MNNAIYSNALTISPVIILNGDTTSGFVNCSELPNRGASCLARISVNAGFPATNLIFETADDVGNNTPGPFRPFYINDGQNTARFTVATIGGAQDIAVPPVYLVSVGFIRVVSSVSVGSDTTVNLVLQPIIQAVA